MNFQKFPSPFLDYFSNSNMNQPFQTSEKISRKEFQGSYSLNVDFGKDQKQGLKLIQRNNRANHTHINPSNLRNKEDKNEVHHKNYVFSWENSNDAESFQQQSSTSELNTKQKTSFYNKFKLMRIEISKLQENFGIMSSIFQTFLLKHLSNLKEFSKVIRQSISRFDEQTTQKQAKIQQLQEIIRVLKQKKEQKKNQFQNQSLKTSISMGKEIEQLKRANRQLRIKVASNKIALSSDLDERKSAQYKYTLKKMKNKYLDAITKFAKEITILEKDMAQLKKQKAFCTNEAQEKLKNKEIQIDKKAKQMLMKQKQLSSVEYELYAQKNFLSEKQKEMKKQLQSKSIVNRMRENEHSFNKLLKNSEEQFSQKNKKKSHYSPQFFHKRQVSYENLPKFGSAQKDSSKIIKKKKLEQSITSKIHKELSQRILEIRMKVNSQLDKRKKYP